MLNEPRKGDVLGVFAGRLRSLREARGMSQEDLADRAGLDRTYVSGCERGVRNPTLKSLDKLANALGVEIQALIGHD